MSGFYYALFFHKNGKPRRWVRGVLFQSNKPPRKRFTRLVRLVIAESGLFEPSWYLEKNQDVAAAGLEPLEHYIASGAAELRDPGPRFDAAWYAKQHAADARAVSNPLLHFIENGGSPEGTFSRRNASLALEILSDIAGIDPEFAGLSHSIEQMLLPFGDGVRRDKAALAWEKLFASLNRSYERIIFVPWLTREGADLVAVNAARATIEKFGAESLLLVVTDSPRVEASDWLPKGAHVRVLSDYSHNLTLNDQIELTSWLIQATKPRSILNVNSRACWELISTRGVAISTFCDIYATFFFRDYQDKNTSSKYADIYFRETIRNLKEIYFDNKAFADEIAKKFAIPPTLRERLVVLYQPAPATDQAGFAVAVPGTQFPVMWAGRLCEEKNVELLIEIAKQGVDFEFEVFGAAETDCNSKFLDALRSENNLIFHPKYSSFVKIPTERFGALLYTTLWDGLPNVLLAAGAAGLPIVAPSIGGIAELVDEKTCWLVTDHCNPVAYLTALNEIMTNPAEALRRTEAMRYKISNCHSWSSYVNSIFCDTSFLR